jgi:hypothetical protein
MANEYAKRKLIELAGKVQGRPTTNLENSQLQRSFDTQLPNTRESVKTVLAESLGKSAGEVDRILASQDDSDRLIDEIVKALDK